MDPSLVFPALGHHDNEREPGGVRADGVANAHIGWLQAVIAALTYTVQKQNHGPLFLGIEVLGHVNLIAVRLTTDGDCPVQKASFMFPCEGSYCTQAEQYAQKYSATSPGSLHGVGV
jgi:hypothetical protein